jgi:MFS family permease
MKALGLWGGIAGLGGTSGTVIGGALVELASWRWIFLVNVPIAAAALLLVPRLVSESRMVRDSRRPDVAGAVTGTAGLIAVVDGLLAAATHPWGSWQVLAPLLGGVALLAVMVAIEARSAAPLIPLEFFRNRTRVVTNGVTLFFSSAFFSYFFLLTLFEQQILGWSPLKGGLSYLPFGLSIGLGIGIGTGVMPRLGVKPLLATGFFGCAAGLFLTSQITVHSSYAGGIVPGMIVLGFFSGISFPSVGNASLHEVTGQDSSLASGVQNAMQQVGGAIGLSCLVTFAFAARDGADGSRRRPVGREHARVRAGLADRRGAAGRRRRTRHRAARARPRDAARRRSRARRGGGAGRGVRAQTVVGGAAPSGSTGAAARSCGVRAAVIPIAISANADRPAPRPLFIAPPGARKPWWPTSCKGAIHVEAVGCSNSSRAAPPRRGTRSGDAAARAQITSERRQSRCEGPAVFGDHAGTICGLPIRHPVEGVAEHLLGQRQRHRHAVQSSLQYTCLFDQLRNVRSCVVPR